MLTQNPPSTSNARSLWIMAAIYFFIYAGIGVNLTYINIYYISRGLTGTQVGIIGTGGGLSAMLASALWGYIADRTGRPNIIMAVGALGTITMALLIPLVSGFPAFLALGILFSFFSSSFFTLVDSTTLNLLGDKREDYGRIRLGGTFGYILATAASGFIFEKIGLVWMFPTYAVITAILAMVALRVPRMPIVHHEHEKHNNALGQMIRRPAWIIFIVSSFLVWTAASGSISFLGITLKSMGASSGLVGIAATMAAVAEIPFMYFSGSLMRRMGLQRMFLVSLFFFTLRIGLYGFMPAPGWAVAINCLNGVSYVFFWNSAVNYANKIAPDSLKSTSQGLFMSATSLSSVVAASISGLMFDSLGGAGLFRVLSLFCLTALILFGAAQFRDRKTA